MSNIFSMASKRIRNHKGLKNYAEKLDLPSFIKTVVSTLADSSFLENYPDQYADLNHFKFYEDDEYDSHIFSIESRIREILVPDFGTGEHLSYVTLQYGYTGEHLDLQDVPGNLVIELHRYFQSWPKSINTTNLLMVYAVFQTLLAQPKLKYLNSGIDHGKYVLQIVTNDPHPQGWFLITLTIDFLPVLLDNAAMEYSHDHRVSADDLNDNDKVSR